MPLTNSPRQRRTPPVVLRRLWIVCLVVAVALLGACTIDPIKDAQRTLEGVPSDKLAEARALEQAGEHAEAAELYLTLAKAETPPARQQLELNGANALLRAGDSTGASRVLTGIDRDRLTAAQRELVLLLEADVALQRGRAAEAIAKLQRVNKGVLPSELKSQYYGTLAAAYRLDKQPIKAAESLDDLDKLLKGDPAARLDNQVSLLFTLATLGRSGLDEAAAETRGRIGGWVELAALVSSFGAPSPELDAQYRRWRSSHGGHPAMPELPRAYFRTLAGGYAPDTDVLVLLPRGGRFGVAGDAVRDGIMAAYNADSSGNRPALDFRSSSGGNFDAGIDAGADLTIGPLQKTEVAALAARSSLPVPTLALNRTDGGSTENLYQFSLAPEDEAINAANYAWASGLRSAAMLYPQGPWGERMAQSFRSQWRTLGGRLAGQQPYNPGDPRFSGDVAALLAAGKADAVFLVASGADVEPLWSALRDADARLPVIATSHVYDGGFDPNRDASLAGLYFVDIPWLLDLERSDSLSRKALREKLPNASGPLVRLYAMGIDGYRLAPRIQEMGNNPGTFFPGETGGLNVDALGQVRRQLVLARFTTSGPEVLRRIEAAPSRAADDADGDAQAEEATE